MYEKLQILSLSVHHLSFSATLDAVSKWGQEHRPSFICFANVHMTIEAYEDKSFRQDLDTASLVVADGKPLAVAARMLYGKRQERIAGMDFMPALLDRANQLNSRIFLYGSTPEVLESLKNKIQQHYKGIEIAGLISPPFGQLESSELDKHIEQINRSGAHFVLVSLGCPKQEKWMAANSPRINAVLLGVGGAFAVTAGLQKRSPVWMQRYGLEWLHRLALEPRRMFRRYLYTNSYFLYLLMKRLITKSS